MIIGFTGTRLGPTVAQHNTMTRLLLRLAVNHGMCRFVHGGGGHSDTLAHHIVTASRLARHIVVEIHPGSDVPVSTVVTVPMGNCEILPERPALERNAIIVRRIHGLIAVPASDGVDYSNTWTTARYAREIGCPVYIIKRNGGVVRYF